MKFSELKSRFKNKYVMRVIAGVLLCFASQCSAADTELTV